MGEDTGRGPEAGALPDWITVFVGWLSTGRKLTQTGRLTLADARTLVELLGTRDQIDPVVGGRVSRTKSSEELSGLNLMFEWAKAARLVRVVHGRVVPVAKNAKLAADPEKLLPALLEAFPLLGNAVAPQAGWFQSPISQDFPAVARLVLDELGADEGTVPLSVLYNMAWERVMSVFVLPSDAHRLAQGRSMNDRDVRRMVQALELAGAVARDGHGAALTGSARAALGHAAGQPQPGEPVFELTVTLRESADPEVWRRILVPAGYPLPRLHAAIQGAMGWTNSHLHQFTVDGTRYTDHTWSEEDDGSKDERTGRLGALVQPGDRFEYEYDFGDGWEHDLVVERKLPAETAVAYPVCAAGQGACPPEDSGGIRRYREELLPALADPGHEEHDAFREWLDLAPNEGFDPQAFDLAEANRRLRRTLRR
jgi:hypothetical protein